MPAPATTDEEFAAAWREHGCSPSRVAEGLGLRVRDIMARRSRLAKRGVFLETIPRDGQFAASRNWSRSSPSSANPARLELNVHDGVVIVFSDAHYWPGEPTPAHRALLSLIGSMKPCVVIANGDMLDGATVSRHDPDGWSPRPTLAQELTVCKERLGEVEDAAGVDAELLWNLGNHDARFERHLAINAPAFVGMPGTTLPEHFPRWTFAMSVMINPRDASPVMVKHRYASGVHSAYNNTVKSGISIVTGHLHRLVVTTWGDYRGRRYGVDTGTLADPSGPQFAYMEDNPSSAGQGFAVLTFYGGQLLAPELVEVRDGLAFFRGAPVR